MLVSSEKTVVQDVNAHITNIMARVKNESEKTSVYISFDNLGYGVVTAVKFSAVGYNAFGDIVSINGASKFILIIQNIRVEKNSSATDLVAALPSKEVQRVDLAECQICCEDGSVLTNDQPDVREFKIKEINALQSDSTAYKAVVDAFSSKIKYIPEETDGGWICGCGHYNSEDRATCLKCDSSKEEVFMIQSEDGLKRLISEYNEREAEKQKQFEKEKAQAIANKKRNRLIIAIASIVIIGILSLVIRGITISGRMTFSSEDDMIHYVYGSYTKYGYSFSHLSISKYYINRTIDIETSSQSGKYSFDVDIKKWNYKSGTIKTVVDTIVVKKNGDLKVGKDTYHKDY